MKLRNLAGTLALAAAALAAAPPAAADINIRISVKFIVNAAGSMPCCGNGTFDSFLDITNQVDFANEQLRGMGRGYQFQIWEVTTVGGPATNFYAVAREEKDALEAAAEADKAGFKYRDNAINMYVNDAAGSAICSFPPTDDIILFGQNSRTTSLWHESGHYFNLAHTHTGEAYFNSNNTDCTNGCACAMIVGGNADGANDTIADHQCWGTQDAIAQGNYGAAYSALSTGQKDLVNAVFNNIMSYHDDRFRMTPDQLDRWTDAANNPRLAVVNGRTHFVATTGSDLNLGTSASRYRTVTKGVGAANDPDDVVLLRAGNYAEAITITKPLTLRATRGNVLIGQ